MKIFYLQDKKNRRVACVASQIVGEKIEFAVSTHNVKLDKYNRDVAREVATGRLTKSGDVDYIRKPKEQGTSVKAEILKAVVADTFVANRARQAAALWLKNNAKKEDVSSQTQ